MAIPTLNAVGFCAHYSKHGDRAFKYALELSQKFNLQLNVFHFLDDPYNPSDSSLDNMSHEELELLAIKKEKELRLYYDKKAGDYLNIGFRVCYDRAWTELHKCLIIREFQILVLGYPTQGGFFARYPIEEFANRFTSPVVLVGPDNERQFFHNSPATLIVDKLGIEETSQQLALEQTV